MLTLDELKQLMKYDPISGDLFWLKSINPRAPAGSLAGKNSISYGYRLISINKIRYRAHHLVWFWFKGEMPKHQIDHINGNKLDNRIENLRDVPQLVNTWNLQSAKKNSKSGLLGVDWKNSHKKWRAQIRVDGQKIQIGLYDTAQEAQAAYAAAKEKRQQNWRP